MPPLWRHTHGDEIVTTPAQPEPAANGRKYFVLDTNVLLHNADAPFMFDDNQVVIPFTVIEELDTFKTDMDDYLKRLRECKPAPGETRVVYPGIPEREAEVERLENGIPYHPEVIDWFRTTCEELQVSHLLG